MIRFFNELMLFIPGPDDTPCFKMNEPGNLCATVKKNNHNKNNNENIYIVQVVCNNNLV